MTTSPDTLAAVSHPTLDAALRDAVEAAEAPGAVALVGHGEDTVFHAAIGQRQLEPEALPAALDTLYDLASLTKAVATTTAILLLAERGEVALDDAVSRFLPMPAFQGVAIRHLLQHTAGLTPARVYYRDCTTINEMLQRYAENEPTEPTDSRWRYSDIGFMVLGRVVEMVALDSLDGFCEREIFAPLGMTQTRFKPPAEWSARCAATERCPWRGRILLGEVHDENAYAVGGVSGHAGLFSTASDLARFCRGLLGGSLLKPETLEAAARLGQVPAYPWQGLGWKLDGWESAVDGYLPARSAMGHSGWTGTSLWLDRREGNFAILLSNTCHPSRANRHNQTLRRTFYGGVARALYPGRGAVHSGLDRLLRERFEPLRDKRVALLTNNAAVDQLGRPCLDVFAYAPPEVRLHIVYSPEHGLRGQAEAGAPVASERGEVAVVSLYGDRRYPSPAELEEIDLFVVDLPDIGSRYYTYMSTMKDCMAACGKANKPVLILDRPNPIGGETLEGPIAKQTDSPVCSAPIPVRHALTLGELALYFARYVIPSPRPTVMLNTLDGWRRAFHFDDCALPWAPPSPNIPDADTAFLYVGLCLFEGTNLNEGRGTDTPFALAGAPWVNAESWLAAVPEASRAGCTLSVARYTPRVLPGKATKPRYLDEACAGIRIRVEDRRRCQPFTLALGLLAALRATHRGQLEFAPFFDTLAGSPWLREQLEAGAAPEAIARAYRADLEAFRQRCILRYE